MELRRGIEYNEAPPLEVADHLRSRHLETIVTQPDRLHVSNNSSELFLRIANGRIREFPVRTAFVFKLLKWFSFPTRQMSFLSDDSLVSILNDYLLRIRSGEVAVRVEDGEALTVLSGKYSPLPDLEVIERCDQIGISGVSRDDFQLRLYSQVQMKTEPVPGDQCGLGFNIFNSETGFRALSMSNYVLRLVCSNGLIVTEKGDDWKPLPHYRVSTGDLRGYLEEKLDVVRTSWSRLAAILKRSASAPFGEGMGEEILQRSRPALGATAARSLSTALNQENLTVYGAVNEITSAAKTLGVSARLQLETLAGDALMRFADRAK
jgi:hypothetical protein